MWILQLLNTGSQEHYSCQSECMSAESGPKLPFAALHPSSPNSILYRVHAKLQGMGVDA